MRKSSKVPVKVLDLKGQENELLSFAKQQVNMSPILGLLHDGPWGCIETKNGLYVVNHLGIGSYSAITSSNRISINFYVCFQDHSFNPISSFEMQFSDVDLLRLPIAKVVRLDKFIKLFGPKTEQQYTIWNKLLSPIVVEEFDEEEGPENNEQGTSQNEEEELPHIELDPSRNEEDNFPKKSRPNTGSIATKKSDLAKYGTFLLNTACECTDSIVLVTVNSNTCICGNKAKHAHCRNCGGLVI